MEYSVNEIKRQFDSHKKLKYIFFWGHQPDKKGEITKSCFSQWYSCKFEVDGILYKTAEQYMMAQKALLFQDKQIYEEIMAAGYPKQYKALGRKIRGFNEQIWKENRFHIVVQGNLAKFSQNGKLEDFLLSSGKRILVEASPYDKIWGIGLSMDTDGIENPHLWKGENLLGFALMEVREQLK